MAKLTERYLKSLPQYLEIVEKLQITAGHPLWFRGTSKLSYPLVPSMYRHPKIKSVPALQELESKLMTRFRQRSLPFHSRDLTNDWEALFFMQHYGAPTRLLDWTENPLTALHFALVSAASDKRKHGEVKHRNSAAVWILDPVHWNKMALRHVSYSGEPLAAGDDLLKGYSPSSTQEGTPARIQ